MTLPKISICIPTFKRVKYLPDLFDSVVELSRLLPGRVEMAVSDNCSNDGTSELVSKYSKIIPTRYYQWPENAGADRNFLKAVEISSGEICTIMGSDDRLLPQNYVKALELFDELSIGVILTDRIDCDIALVPIEHRRWFRCSDRKWQLFKSRDFDDWLKQSTSLGCAFSYLSVITFRRSLWCVAADSYVLIGSAYVHAAILLRSLSLTSNNLSLLYKDIPTVLSRGGNDSFRKKSVVRRLLLDIDGYRIVLAHSDFPKDHRERALRALIGSEHRNQTLLFALWLKADSELKDWVRFVDESRAIYPLKWTVIVANRISHCVLQRLLSIYRIGKKYLSFKSLA